VNPNPSQTEGYLPSVNTPCSYNPYTQTYWVRAKMPDDYADSFIAVLAAYPDVAGQLLNEVIVMRPILDSETGEPQYPEEPHWEVPILDEVGNQVGTQQVYVGRIN
jgi:hypothetical protein